MFESNQKNPNSLSILKLVYLWNLTPSHFTNPIAFREFPLSVFRQSSFSHPSRLLPKICCILLCFFSSIFVDHFHLNKSCNLFSIRVTFSSLFLILYLFCFAFSFFFLKVVVDVIVTSFELTFVVQHFNFLFPTVQSTPFYSLLTALLLTFSAFFEEISTIGFLLSFLPPLLLFPVFIFLPFHDFLNFGNFIAFPVYDICFFDIFVRVCFAFLLFSSSSLIVFVCLIFSFYSFFSFTHFITIIVPTYQRCLSWYVPLIPSLL